MQHRSHDVRTDHVWSCLARSIYCEITSPTGGSITCVMADLFIDASARLRVSNDSCRLQRYPVAELGLRPRSTSTFWNSDHYSTR